MNTHFAQGIFYVSVGGSGWVRVFAHDDESPWFAVIKQVYVNHATATASTMTMDSQILIMMLFLFGLLLWSAFK
jgi:predicted ATP-grasp superfamily ATP-dependent carboligase